MNEFENELNNLDEPVAPDQTVDENLKSEENDGFETDAKSISDVNEESDQSEVYGSDFSPGEAKEDFNPVQNFPNHKNEEKGNYNYDYTIPLGNGPDNSEPQKTSKKGLGFFAAALAGVIVLCSAITAGYIFGQKSANKVYSGSNQVNLQSKPTDTEQMTADGVYESVNKSIVGIVVYNNSGISGKASGVIYSEDGYVITNDHIYKDVDDPKFKIYTYDNSVYDAVFIAGDTRSDLAVLKIDVAGFYPATFGNSEELNFGETVVAVGRSVDATEYSSITEGIVSFLNRRVSNASNYSSKLIQTDSVINPGSSGGALLNMYGQVVGITSSKIVASEYEGIGFAIPSVTVKSVVEELIDNGGVVSRAKLGITYQEIDSLTASINKYPAFGLCVVEVSDDSNLKNKLNKGDIITAVNNIEITKDDIILDIIESSKPNDKITLTVYTSDGTLKTFDAVLMQDSGTSSYSSAENSGLIPLPN